MDASIRRRRTPPPESLIDALCRFGVSRETALAMDVRKAEEVLRLVEPHRARETADDTPCAQRRA